MNGLLSLLLLGSLQAAEKPKPDWVELLCPVADYHEFKPILKNFMGFMIPLNCNLSDGINSESRIQTYFLSLPAAKNPAPVKIEGKKNKFFSPGLLVDETHADVLHSGADLCFPECPILVGKLIPVEILSFPQKTGILFHLSRLRIILTSQKGAPWVVYRDLMQQPAKDFEAEILPLMLAEIQAQAAKAGQVYTQPLNDGLFAGQSLQATMQNSTLEDLQDFLDFVLADAENYLGRSWKLAEVYASWLINGAPAAEDLEMENIPDEIRPPTPEEQTG